jgi:hypothetical protein
MGVKGLDPYIILNGKNSVVECTLWLYAIIQMMKTPWSHGHVTHMQRHQFSKNQVNQVWYNDAKTVRIRPH